MDNLKTYFIAPEDKSTWYNKNNLWETCLNSWKNSTFDVQLLNDERDIEVIIDRYDEDNFSSVLKEIPKINSIDYVRYVLLANFGGMYIDMDVYLNNDFKHLIDPNSIYIAGRGKEGIANCIIISPPHELWKQVMKECRNRILNSLSYLKVQDKIHLTEDNLKRKIDKQSFLTGSTVISDVITEMNLWKKVHILDDKFFNREAAFNPFAYTIHYQTGLWRLSEKVRKEKMEANR